VPLSRHRDTACPKTLKSVTGRISRYPDVIGIGFPKCGTSTLGFIDCHSKMVFREAEPYYFNNYSKQTPKVANICHEHLFGAIYGEFWTNCVFWQNVICDQIFVFLQFSFLYNFRFLQFSFFYNFRFLQFLFFYNFRFFVLFCIILYNTISIFVRNYPWKFLFQSLFYCNFTITIFRKISNGSPRICNSRSCSGWNFSWENARL